MSKETVLARYTRESTLWKNANVFYVAQDWVLMECLFVDMSEERKLYSDDEVRILDKNTGEDVTSVFYSDRFVIRLTNKRVTNTKSFSFLTKEEANEMFKRIMEDKVLRTFRKAV